MAESEPDRQRADGAITGRSWRSLASRVVALVAVLALFVLALLFDRAVARSAESVFAVGDPGTVSNLLVGVVGLQVLGFGTAAVLFLSSRETDWHSYLRLGELSAWTVFYGTAVGLALMIVVSLATGVFTLFDVEPTESVAGRATDPLFYLVLFVVSTFVVVPMEEAFFRGGSSSVISEDQFHVGVAVGVASMLLTLIHTGRPSVRAGTSSNSGCSSRSASCSGSATPRRRTCSFRSSLTPASTACRSLSGRSRWRCIPVDGTIDRFVPESYRVRTINRSVDRYN